MTILRLIRSRGFLKVCVFFAVYALLWMGMSGYARCLTRNRLVPAQSDDATPDYIQINARTLSYDEQFVYVPGTMPS